MLFAVSALRNSAWGVAALFGFTFVSGVFLTPILSVAAALDRLGIGQAEKVAVAA